LPGAPAAAGNKPEVSAFRYLVGGIHATSHSTARSLGTPDVAQPDRARPRPSSQPGTAARQISAGVGQTDGSRHPDRSITTMPGPAAAQIESREQLPVKYTRLRRSLPQRRQLPARRRSVLLLRLTGAIPCRRGLAFAKVTDAPQPQWHLWCPWAPKGFELGFRVVPLWDEIWHHETGKTTVDAHRGAPEAPNSGCPRQDSNLRRPA